MIINLISNQLKQGKKFIFFIGFKTIADVIFLLIPLFVAKLLNPELFGSFSLLKMILFFGVTVFLTPLMAPLNIESNKEYSETKKSNKTFTSAIVYLFCSISIFLLIYLFFGKELIAFTGLNYNEFKYVFLLAFFGLSIKNFLSAFFMSQDNKKANVFVDLLYSLALILYIFIMFYFKIFNLYNIFLGFFIASITTLIISLFFVDFERILPLSFSSSNFKTIRNFSFWVILGGTSSYFINWGDNLVLRYFVSLEDIGIYNFAYQIFKGFIMISLMINTYFTPFIARNKSNKDELKLYYTSKRPKILLLSFFALLVSNILLYFFIHCFYRDFIRSIIIINILSIGVLCSFYYAFLIPIFNTFNHYKMTQILLVLQILLNLILNLILVPFYGILGSAISTVLAYIAFTIVYNLFFRNKILKRLF
jgi:O-antigen/teichoic acid export membrane protein